jgi:hypothetical protein
MDDANAGLCGAGLRKALPALDEAYKLMNGDPSEEWETLNNAVVCTRTQKAARLAARGSCAARHAHRDSA